MKKQKVTTKKEMIAFVAEKEFASFDEIRFKFYNEDSKWYLTLNDLLMSGEIRRIGGVKNSKYSAAKNVNK